MCSSDLDLARAAVEEEAPVGMVGDHLGFEADEERVVTHFFACLDPAYAGWRWAATLARASRSKTATVDEVVLLPGPDALVAPTWVPWSARVQPGDLSAGMVWPTALDDPRLVAGLTGVDDLDGAASLAPLFPGQWEIGLGRERVLSVHGREEAAIRWQEGERGPESAMARSVSLTCSSCGFLLTIAGPLGQAFGICAQEMSPADGCVVSLAYGCGAHSQIVEPASPTPIAASEPGEYEVVNLDDIEVTDEVEVVQADEVAEGIEVVEESDSAKESAEEPQN